MSRWTCLITLSLVFAQLSCPSFAFDDLFSNEPFNDNDGASSFFLDADDFSGGNGRGSYLTEQPQFFDEDVDVDSSALTISNPLTQLADASHDACIGFSSPDSSSFFRKIRVRANACETPNVNFDGGKRTQPEKAITAEQIKKYWCTDFPSVSVSSQEAEFGNIPVCYGSEGEGLSGSSVGGPILPPNWWTRVDQSPGIFQTLYNCVLSKGCSAY